MPRVFNVVATFEKDGVTPRANTYKIDYGEDLKGGWNEARPIVAGSSMVLTPTDQFDDRVLTTTKVQSVEDDGTVVRVTTKNTIYVLEVVE